MGEQLLIGAIGMGGGLMGKIIYDWLSKNGKECPLHSGLVADIANIKDDIKEIKQDLKELLLRSCNAPELRNHRTTAARVAAL